MSSFVDRRLSKRPDHNSHTSMNLNLAKTKVFENLKHQRNHSSFPSDIEHSNTDHDFRHTSKRQKADSSEGPPELILSRSCSNSVKGPNTDTLDYSNASKKSISKLNSPGQNTKRSFVEGANRRNGLIVSRNMEYSLSSTVIMSQDDRNEVKETLKRFRELYEKLSRQKVAGAGRVDMEAATHLKKEGKWIRREKQFGHVPGIAIGDQFNFRLELHIVGLHCQNTAGIDYMPYNKKKYAVSIVDSGRFENRAESRDVLIYTGQGGHEAFGRKADQKLERGNLALSNNIKAGYPVRVVRKMTHGSNSFAYVYDGLYMVKKFWQQRDCESGKLVFKFELHRIVGQATQISGELSKLMTSTECCVKMDISDGKENKPICVMNGVDSEKPPSFTYITKMMYPEGLEPIQGRGCNCTDSCSNLGKCACVLRNGGENLFNDEKAPSLGKEDCVVYACGPSCTCPSCTNRVTEDGLRYKLELFKIGSDDWGVRSRSYITSGSFVCEYLGKLVPGKDAKKNTNDGEGSFMCFSLSVSTHLDSENIETRFIIDARKFGNVGRFIRASNSPNLFIRHVVYDHDGERIPHVMFFAAKHIKPSQELSYDYNHQIAGETSQCQFRVKL